MCQRHLIQALKHLNRLENVLARKGLNKKFFDVIMIDDNKKCMLIVQDQVCLLGMALNYLHLIIKNSGISGVTKFIIEKNIKKLNLTMSLTTPIKLETTKKSR